MRNRVTYIEGPARVFSSGSNIFLTRNSDTTCLYAVRCLIGKLPVEL